MAAALPTLEVLLPVFLVEVIPLAVLAWLAYLSVNLARHGGRRVYVGLAVGVLVAAALGFIVGANPRAVMAFRDLDHHEYCKGNLAFTRSAMASYAAEHDGYLPPSLEAVREGGYLKEGIELSCPATGERYIYLFEGKRVRLDDLPPSVPLVMDRGFPHNLGRIKIMAPAGGSVAFLSIEQVSETLDEDLAVFLDVLGLAWGTEMGTAKALLSSAPAADSEEPAAGSSERVTQ